MVHLLKRHLVSIQAEFEFVLVLTYAVPPAALGSFLAPGLQLDLWNGHAFLAVAFVQTRHLRPTGLPRGLGLSFFLSGYRAFVRYRTADGRELRGLKIIRSDADSRAMVTLGNALTHYNYQLAKVRVQGSSERLELRVSSRDGQGDAELVAHLVEAAALPEGSPFPDEPQARRFMGPMPYTFDYERQTHSMIAVQGLRRDWRPRMVPVSVHRLSFLDRRALEGTRATLASCFYVEGVDYRWKRGVRESLPRHPVETEPA